MPSPENLVVCLRQPTDVVKTAGPFAVHITSPLHPCGPYLTPTPSPPFASTLRLPATLYSVTMGTCTSKEPVMDSHIRKTDDSNRKLSRRPPHQTKVLAMASDIASHCVCLLLQTSI